jgi:hypothetical protein
MPAPSIRGKRCEDWQLQDPAGQPVEVVRGIRDRIDARVRQLLTELPPGTDQYRVRQIVALFGSTVLVVARGSQHAAEVMHRAGAHS